MHVYKLLEKTTKHYNGEQMENHEQIENQHKTMENTVKSPKG